MKKQYLFKKMLGLMLCLGMANTLFNSCSDGEFWRPIENEVKVTGITINPSGNVGVGVDKTTILTATVTPKNAANKNVTWSSLNTGIATVDASTGMVTGVSAGTAIIRASATDGSGITANKSIAVTQPEVKVTGITINPSESISVEVGKTTTLTASIAPSNATNKNVTWSSLNTGFATVNASTGVVIGVSAGAATLRATAADGSGIYADKSITVTTTASVVINGVTWATCNVDQPGTFAAKSEDAGMFYQWNRKIGWSATDPIINSNGGATWDSSVPAGTTWDKVNDPSPAGWRVPTLEEFEKLCDTDKVSHVWTTQNGVIGKKFTDKTSGNFIFLPAAGYRSDYDGTLCLAGLGGDYWSSTAYDTHYAAYYLYFASGGAGWHYYYGNLGRSVRAVAE